MIFVKHGVGISQFRLVKKKIILFSSPLCFKRKKIKAVSRYVALSFLKAPPKNEKEFKVFKKLKNRNET